jgi:hypothetical protein
MTSSGCSAPWPGRQNQVSWPGRQRRVRRSFGSPPRPASRSQPRDPPRSRGPGAQPRTGCPLGAEPARPGGGPCWRLRCARRRPCWPVRRRPTRACCPSPSSRWPTLRSARRPRTITARPLKPGPGRGMTHGTRPVRRAARPRSPAMWPPPGRRTTPASRPRATSRRYARGVPPRARPSLGCTKAPGGFSPPGLRPACSRSRPPAQRIPASCPSDPGTPRGHGPACRAAAEIKMRPNRSSQIACGVGNLRI